jgi:hypothetical protein
MSERIGGLHHITFCTDTVQGDVEPSMSSQTPPQYAIRGFHSSMVIARETEDMNIFMTEAWNYRKLGQDGDFIRYAVDGGCAAHIVDIRHQPDKVSGSWFYGERIVHHGAFVVPDLDMLKQVKLEVEGLGLTDFSDRKHREYSESIYVRKPGGAFVRGHAQPKI